jgi:hypothetical protein
MVMRSLDHLVRALLKQRRHAEAGRLAVLRLISTSNLRGAWTGLVGLRALKNKIGISPRAPKNYRSGRRRRR